MIKDDLQRNVSVCDKCVQSPITMEILDLHLGCGNLNYPPLTSISGKFNQIKLRATAETNLTLAS